MQYTFHYDSPLGSMIAASDGKALTGLWFDGQKYFDGTFALSHEEKMLSVFSETKKWLDTYFSGKKPDFTPPLAMNATLFRKAVWKILLAIPYGKTTSYGEIAEKIVRQRYAVRCAAARNSAQHTARTAKTREFCNVKLASRKSAQAVGGAVAHNPISLIIPCHRVVGTDGSLTGYAGGIDRKIKLLTLEGADMSHFYVPKKGTAL